jgi:isopentenyl phosphate kinase
VYQAGRDLEVHVHETANVHSGRPLASKLAEPLDSSMVISRPAELDRIVKALRSRRAANVVILEGAGGFGKSVLARAASTHRAVRRRYSSIYRVRCGEQALTDFEVAQTVNTLLSDMTGRRPVHTDPEAAGQDLVS